MAERSPEQPVEPGAQGTAPNRIQLINVLVVREGEQVSSQWGIHPQLKQDLAQTEWQELSEHMNRVTAIVGAKFAQQLLRDEGNAPGHGTA
ncbi:MAG: hypothetical protein HY284_08655 [Nitrospirae bacterium]|nr:hypothetical protein [Nitrospirota bacterium]